MQSKIAIGQPLSRVDGVDKVTGKAKYAAEHDEAGLLYGVVVSSAIARGKITAIDETSARAVSGVVEIITHSNRPHIAWFDSNYQDDIAPPGKPFRALYDSEIHFSQQPVALVVAETFEAARYAASLVNVQYEQAEHVTDFEVAKADRFMPRRTRSGFHPPKNRGDARAAFDKAPVKVKGTYHLAVEHHNPMEMHATTVMWDAENESITVHDKTQGSQNVHSYICNVFGMRAKDVRVLNPYVGGAFGSGLRPHFNVYLAVMAARMLKRSVRVVLRRQEMFSHVHRPECEMTVELGADQNGKLLSVINTASTATSRFENYMEDIVVWGMAHYACENAEGDYGIVPRDTATPGDMRAPGAATSLSMFEVALDELAYATNVDPIELRLRNYAETDQMNGTPYTSKALREAYAQGAAKFGWNKRSMAPRSMKDGKELVGWGMATGVWDAMFQKTAARATMTANGHLEIACATSDIGTGTYTVLTQVAAETLGLALDQITVKIGDSDLPAAPVEGGSWGAASGGAAVQLACQSLGKALVSAADKVDGKPLKGARVDDVDFVDGEIVLRSDRNAKVSYIDVMRAAKLPSIEVEETASGGVSGMVSQMRYSRNTHAAVFAEVKVDEQLGIVRVTRVVSAVAAGRIINPQTARSQILGGVVMGIGMALHEESMLDHKLGRFMNHSFAEYHVPAHADIHDIDVIFVPENDPEVTPLGVKGLGEIGIVGTAGAVANAIHHATGKRLRDFPITIDKIRG